jgi:hypothetical protein
MDKIRARQAHLERTHKLRSVVTLVTARVQRRTGVEQGHVINVPKLGPIDLAPLRSCQGLHLTNRAVRADV